MAPRAGANGCRLEGNDMAKQNKDKKANTSQGVKEPGKYSLENIKKFGSEVQSEFNKITWPDKKHTMGATGVVVVLVTIISIYLGAVDLIVGKIIGSVLQ